MRTLVKAMRLNHYINSTSYGTWNMIGSNYLSYNKLILIESVNKKNYGPLSLDKQKDIYWRPVTVLATKCSLRGSEAPHTLLLSIKDRKSAVKSKIQFQRISLKLCHVALT